MKKQYFSPEMEEMDVDIPNLLVGSCNDELPGGDFDACPDEEIIDV